MVWDLFWNNFQSEIASKLNKYDKEMTSNRIKWESQKKDWNSNSTLIILVLFATSKIFYSIIINI